MTNALLVTRIDFQSGRILLVARLETNNMGTWERHMYTQISDLHVVRFNGGRLTQVCVSRLYVSLEEGLVSQVAPLLSNYPVSDIRWEAGLLRAVCCSIESFWMQHPTRDVRSPKMDVSVPKWPSVHSWRPFALTDYGMLNVLVCDLNYTG